ncbi:hypothetical protein [Amycolatopsis sp. NPDC052450]|uniref:hypothetical protein n=1 Tax=Amycolatopsis sp. NPDC052450 TaxID=3363937 RepID=UPI0037CC341C
MPRRPKPLSRDDGPLAAFALDLRALRDSGGPTAPSPDVISAKEDVHRTTIYAALAGKRVPSRDALAAMVKHWNGDQVEWTAKRSNVENALATARQLQEQQREVTVHETDDSATWGELSRAGVTWGDLAGTGRAQPSLTDRDRREFAADLKLLIQASGLGYRTISKAARQFGEYMGPSTISDAVQGRRLPKLQVVLAIVKVVTGDDAEVEKWKERWLQLQFRKA